ncbi:hypothetical protein A2875_01125 [Candidatus Gottesmanbacteria bacterium RIFCSPHIGHO2_01_FULL_46_14]|uniref:PIN domain-containing protein n=2 Tax=Candidatus Gottesmaniibacteriota TaxID=1752720 RepID=A0A1F5ZMM9_9BACT|nr:MAG: hypothetical protein A2875_01125 [Candidatus Gottesmanbacteria bacterium RIFCSPHIGHO2_01_FULL_46_14]
MKKCYLDSNFLLYWKNELSPQYQQTISMLETLINNGVELYISPLVLDEFYHSFLYRIRINRMKKPYDLLTEATKDILTLPRLSIVNPPSVPTDHLTVIANMEMYYLHARDAYHLLIMQSNDIDGFATFDTDFARVFTAKLLIKA